MADPSVNILLVDDDEDAFFLTKDLLGDGGTGVYNVRWCSRYEDAPPEIAKGGIDVCLIDHYLGARTGLELVRELSSAGVEVPLILVTGRGDRQIDLDAMNAGAADYLAKDDLTAAVLERTVRYSIQRSRDQIARRQLERMLVQSQKLEAIGQLAAGIAHEINTPVQYIGSNVSYLELKVTEAYALLEQLDSVLSGSSQPSPEMKSNLEKVLSNKDHIKTALHDSQDGIRRISEIVRSVQDFAHPSVATETTPCKLHDVISATIKLAVNEWKYLAEVRTDFSPKIDLVPIVKGRFEQAVLNLIVNAAHAIAERQMNEEVSGLITITTRALDGEGVEIRISDNGCGIPSQNLTKIFDPFFTTKDVGKGTGQGLALVHAVFCQSHGGSIRVESEINRGTTFIVVIPFGKEERA